VAPILVSLGLFLSVLSPKAERPNGLINLIYLATLIGAAIGMTSCMPSSSREVIWWLSV
jgi:hypothetical protein